MILKINLSTFYDSTVIIVANKIDKIRNIPNISFKECQTNSQNVTTKFSIAKFPIKQVDN
jgi:hypothetical protein